MAYILVIVDLDQRAGLLQLRGWLRVSEETLKGMSCDVT